MKKKYIMIGSLLVIGAIALGSSLAWWTWSTSSNEQTNVVVTVGGITINYEDGENITNNNLIPTSTKEKGISKNITVSSTGQVYLDLNMAIVTLEDGLKDASFKYEIYNGSELVTGGNFANSNVGDNIALLSGVEVTSSPTTYTLYIWIDGNMSNPNTMYNQNFEFRLNAEATDEKPVIPATDTIADIYTTANKTEVVNNDVTYNYATEVGMMEDIGGNIRYYGADPNNYVTFNNELWRIIGVFKDIDDGTGTKETRIKIARSESIGNYAWDNKPSGTGSSTSQYGSNEWSDSALMNVLNNGAYYNRTTGTCPSGQNGATKSCDFSTTGLTDEAKNMIGDALWNLGGNSTSSIYANDYYTFERGTTVYSGRSTTWTGKIALMYPSDYMYAGDLSKCSSDGYNWNDDQTNCRDTSWLRNTNTAQWTLTPNASNSNRVFYVDRTGYVSNDLNVLNTNASRPVLFLKSNVQITGGDGSQNNPFTLG